MRWGEKAPAVKETKAVGRLSGDVLKVPTPEEPKAKPAKAPSKAVAALASKQQAKELKVEATTAEEGGSKSAETEKKGVGRLGECGERNFLTRGMRQTRAHLFLTEKIVRIYVV